MSKQNHRKNKKILKNKKTPKNKKETQKFKFSGLDYSIPDILRHHDRCARLTSDSYNYFCSWLNKVEQSPYFTRVAYNKGTPSIYPDFSVEEIAQMTPSERLTKLNPDGKTAFGAWRYFRDDVALKSQKSTNKDKDKNKDKYKCKLKDFKYSNQNTILNHKNDEKKAKQKISNTKHPKLQDEILALMGKHSQQNSERIYLRCINISGKPTDIRNFIPSRKQYTEIMVDSASNYNQSYHRNEQPKAKYPVLNSDLMALMNSCNLYRQWILYHSIAIRPIEILDLRSEQERRKLMIQNPPAYINKSDKLPENIADISFLINRIFKQEKPKYAKFNGNLSTRMYKYIQYARVTRDHLIEDSKWKQLLSIITPDQSSDIWNFISSTERRINAIKNLSDKSKQSYQSTENKAVPSKSSNIQDYNLKSVNKRPKLTCLYTSQNLNMWGRNKTNEYSDADYIDVEINNKLQVKHKIINVAYRSSNLAQFIHYHQQRIKFKMARYFNINNKHYLKHARTMFFKRQLH